MKTSGNPKKIMRACETIVAHRRTKALRLQSSLATLPALCNATRPVQKRKPSTHERTRATRRGPPDQIKSSPRTTTDAARRCTTQKKRVGKMGRASKGIAGSHSQRNEFFCSPDDKPLSYFFLVTAYLPKSKFQKEPFGRWCCLSRVRVRVRHVRWEGGKKGRAERAVVAVVTRSFSCA